MQQWKFLCKTHDQALMGKIGVLSSLLGFCYNIEINIHLMMNTLTKVLMQNLCSLKHISMVT